MSLTKDELIYMSKVTEQTERFEDMLAYMKKLALEHKDLSIEERNLLSVAYKNSVGSRRTAWRVISSIEQKEEAKGSKHLSLLKEYKKKIEDELNKFCDDILDLLDNTLIPNAQTSESKVFFQKMKGDYHRYVSEYASGEAHQKASENALAAYNAGILLFILNKIKFQASDLATKDLKTTHPIRLGLFLNFSVFYYEVMNDPTKACNLAKQAFDEAIADIEHIDDDQYKDATTIMQLIRDNLTLWTSEMQDDGDEAAEGEENQ